MKIKVLIVGGAGYIGAHVALTFQDAGYEVTVFDNLSTGQKSNLIAEQKFIHGDLLQLDQIQSALATGYDLVVHLAALKSAPDSMLQVNKYAQQNLTGSINLLQAMSEADQTPILIFASTAAIYGTPQYLPVDEEHRIHPENFYGFTKLSVEDLLHWYSRLQGIHFASLRFFNAAGYDQQGRIASLEQNPANLLPLVIEVAQGVRPELLVFGQDYNTKDGSGARDYIHVTDLAEAQLLAYQWVKENQRSITLNLGTGVSYTVLEVIERAKSLFKVEIPFQVVNRRTGDAGDVYSSLQKAKDLLHWEPKHSDLDSILLSMWKQYQRQL